MQIYPISDRSKTDLISEVIIEQIASGTWHAGERIPGENDLANQLNVSRTSVRQAISQLVGQGILSIRRGEGTFVNEILPEDFFANLRQLFIMETPKYLEVQEFRKIIEPSIAYYAAIKADEKDIKALGDSVEYQEECARKKDYKAYSKEDVNFHKLLAECTKNSMVIKTLEIIGELMDRAMEHTTAITGFTNGVKFHKDLYECIKRRDSEKAFNIMCEHIENNIKAIHKKKEKSACKEDNNHNIDHIKPKKS